MWRRLRGRDLGAAVVGLLVAGPLIAAAPGRSEAQVPPRPVVEAAIASLRESSPVFVDPNAPLAPGPEQIRAVERAVARAGTPIMIAILPGSAGRAHHVARQLREGVDRPATYVAVSGEVYEAISDVIDIRGLIQQAFTLERNNGTAEVLIEFIELTSARAAGRESQPAGPEIGPEIAVVAIAVVGLIAFALVPARRPKESQVENEPQPPERQPSG